MIWPTTHHDHHRFSNTVIGLSLRVSQGAEEHKQWSVIFLQADISCLALHARALHTLVYCAGPANAPVLQARSA